jgi:hypothetical protein
MVSLRTERKTLRAIAERRKLSLEGVAAVPRAAGGSLSRRVDKSAARRENKWAPVSAFEPPPTEGLGQWDTLEF